MPKGQSTAAKRARAAVRDGAAKYTTALREESAGHQPAVPGPGPHRQVPPCPDLPYEVVVFADPGYDKGEIYGRDYGGSVPAWWTRAWARSADRAAEVARAVVAWHGGDRVATVWGPGTGGRRQLLRVEAGPAPRAARPCPEFGATPPGVRPASPAPIPQPALGPGISEREAPRFCLRVWTPERAWEEVAWFDSRSAAGVTAAHLLVGIVGHRYPFADVYGPGRSGDREVMDLIPRPSSAERGEDPSARGTSYAELYHPDHAESRARWAAERRAAYDAVFSDPGPGTCGTCREVRPLVWSWGICQRCYDNSAFDPPYETFIDVGEDDEHPDDRAAAFAEGWQSARYGE